MVLPAGWNTPSRTLKQSKAKMSPTQRSLALLRSEGWTAAVVERWNAYAKIRQDLYGFIDILAFNGEQVLAVQTTSGAHSAERLWKIAMSAAARLWLVSPHRTIEVHGWAKRGERGKRKLWTCNRRTITLKDFSLTENTDGDKSAPRK